MAIKSSEKEIGGLTFEVTQLPYFRAQRLFVRLVKLGGPVLLGLGQVAGASGAKAALAAIAGMEVGSLAQLLGTLFDRLDPDDAESITKAILETTRVKHEGKWVALVSHMDAVVGGDFWTGLQVQGFALSVHFEGFSLARFGLGGPGQKADASKESTTSTASGG